MIFRLTALSGIVLSLVLMALIGLARPPATVPEIDGTFVGIDWVPTPDLAVTAVLWTAMIVGALGSAAGLLALRRGWEPRAVPMLVGGGVAVAVLVVLPPMGTTDPMDYAAYGRMAVMGIDPHVTTPAQFRLTGDPIALLAPREWEDIPSVYGPLATASQWAASRLAGTSAMHTVFYLKLWNGLAFVVAAVCLTRLAGPRAHVFWTLNPLLLWALVGGAHVDALSAALVIGALTVLRERPWPAAVAGVLLGAAGAVKLPYLLVGAGMFYLARRSPQSLVVLCTATATTLVATYAFVGTSAIESVIERGALPSWNTPWQLVLEAGTVAPSWLTWASLGLMGCAALLFLRCRVDGPPWLLPALAVCLAWVVTTPVYYPWYEALLFPLIAIAPASNLDWFQLARTLVATIGALPGVVIRLGDSWLRSAVEQGPLPNVVPVLLFVLAVPLVAMALRQPLLLTRSQVHPNGGVLPARGR